MILTVPSVCELLFQPFQSHTGVTAFWACANIGADAWFVAVTQASAVMVRLAPSVVSVCLKVQVFQGQAMASVSGHITPSTSFENVLGRVTLPRDNALPKIISR